MSLVFDAFKEAKIQELLGQLREENSAIIMSKSKESSELEYVRAENRKLKAEVKHLRKEVNRLNKRKHQMEDIEERERDLELQEQNEEQDLQIVCPDCRQPVEPVDLGVRVLLTCKTCGYRKAKKK